MEERVLYFDIINGISGDMTIATLLDLGIPKEVFLEEIYKLNLDDEFKINIEQKNESGIVGTKIEVITKEVNSHRHLSDIYDIIDKSSLNEFVKNKSKEIFMVIAKAEAKVHGTTIDKIHFHEVGAIDSIVDVVSACILVDLLGIDKIYSTSVPVGSGFVKCDHGLMPVPAPATIEILKDVPIKLNTVKGECTTPTGAAIIKTLCDEFVDTLEFEVKRIGYGMGHKKFEIPNILRSILGVKKKKNLYMK
ncbi:MAG: nickel pincer cofactor biosynthesis protein LarC [Romboutsia sp.]|nr:nickel pincer cofactor biosynthesis protein LarC [Romboutsia sp.]